MAEIENGLPPDGLDVTQGGVFDVSYSDDKLRDENREQQVSSFSYAEDEIITDETKQQVSSFTYSVDFEGVNYMTMT